MCSVVEGKEAEYDEGGNSAGASDSTVEVGAALQCRLEHRFLLFNLLRYLRFHAPALASLPRVVRGLRIFEDCFLLICKFFGRYRLFRSDRSFNLVGRLMRILIFERFG